MTKKQVIKEKIEALQFDLYSMEIVVDYNASLPESETTKSEIAKAKVRIDMILNQLEWLKKHLKSLE